ncbi:DMT family transporter [Intestinibacillus massiliensis]|uniref:DMT family transporter n=1 Tax=Intestinibacillus massiliensis TaxID=1871029 RepID=UPI000B35650C|nr:DMT family transporter [Intestinibacillus massiliensis]
MDTNKPSLGHLLAFFTVLVWGTTFISTKILLRSFSPVEILFYRFGIGYLALWLFCPRPLRLSIRRQEAYFAAAGLCGMTLYYLFENIALTYSLASSVGVIVSIAPFFTALLAHFFLDGEALRPNFICGFACAITGIILISWNGSAVFQLNPLGDILAVLAAFVWAVYSILGRKISAFGYNTIQTTRRTFLWGLVFMIPALALFGFQFGFSRFAAPLNLANMAYLAIGASAICFVTWNLAVRVLGAVKSCVYIYMTPVISVIGSALILHERVTKVTVLGTALTLMGLFLSEWRLPQRAAAE